MRNICYICLEPCWSYHQDDMYLVDYKRLYFDCNCTVHTHKRCMQIWLNRNPSCIICRRNAQIYRNWIFANFRSILCNMFIVWYIYTIVLHNFHTKTCRDT